MKTLILGGIRSGKSRLAENLAQQSGKNLIYVATATASDHEMKARIEKHQAYRNKEWVVVEEAHHIGKILNEFSSDKNCLLVDCLTLWMTNLLMAEDEKFLQQQRQTLLKAASEFKGKLFMVGNETSMGIIPNGELTRRFCDEAGILHQEVAALSDKVVLTVAGLPLILKGEPLHGMA